MLSKSNFSFTFNLDPEKGDFILKKDKQEASSMMSSQKGEEKGGKEASVVRSSSCRHSRQIDLKAMDEELAQVSDRMAKKSAVRDSHPQHEGQQKSSSKSGQSITSTPTRNLEEKSSKRGEERDHHHHYHHHHQHHDTASSTASGVDLFNQDSFISSIPDHRPGEDDTTLFSSSIHRMHRNMRQKKKVYI